MIDAGANRGAFALEVARRNIARVYAIEPIPQLAEALAAEAAHQELDVVVIQKAVGKAKGQSTLNVAINGDMGITSLLELRSDLSDDAYWSTRSDLVTDNQITVDVVSLQDIVTTFKIKQIDFLKIDCQGLDLAVLRSLGNRIDRLRGGMLEMATVDATTLYRGESDILRDALVFLDEHDFQVYAIKPNDPANNEVNVYFCQKSLNWNDYERDIGLKGIGIYDGRHFWHLPSPSPKIEDTEVLLALRGSEGLVVRLTSDLSQAELRLAETSLALSNERGARAADAAKTAQAKAALKRAAKKATDAQAIAGALQARIDTDSRRLSSLERRLDDAEAEAERRLSEIGELRIEAAISSAKVFESEDLAATRQVDLDIATKALAGEVAQTAALGATIDGLNSALAGSRMAEAVAAAKVVAAEAAVARLKVDHTVAADTHERAAAGSAVLIGELQQRLADTERGARDLTAQVADTLICLDRAQKEVSDLRTEATTLRHRLLNLAEAVTGVSGSEPVAPGDEAAIVDSLEDYLVATKANHDRVVGDLVGMREALARSERIRQRLEAFLGVDNRAGP